MEGEKKVQVPLYFVLSSIYCTTYPESKDTKIVKHVQHF